MSLRISLLTPALVAASALAGVPQPGVDLSPWGCQIVWASDPNLTTYMNHLQSAAAQVARGDLIWWSLCENPVGTFEFVSPNVPGWESWNADNWLTQLEARGIEPYALLAYNHPVLSGDQGPNTAQERQDFGDYAVAAATRYADRIDIWEIYNEPNLAQFWGTAPSAADYTALVAHVAPRLRAADATTIIVGGVTSGIDMAYLTQCFDAGLLQHIDKLSVHPYRTTHPESVNSELAALRSLMDTYAGGPSVEIWTGEWGYNAAYTELGSTQAEREEGQARVLTRMMLNNLTQGVELSIWFSVHGWDTLEDWGLTPWNNPAATRPSHTAFQVLNATLPPPVRHVGDPYGFAFSPTHASFRAEAFERTGPTDRVVALWWARALPPASTPLVTDATLHLALPMQLRALDSRDGSEIALDARWDLPGGTVTLFGFEMWDYVTFLEITPEALPPGTNVAPAAVAHAADSEFPGFPGTLALDGQITVASKWTSADTPPPHWLALDLGSPQRLTGAALRLPSLAGEFSLFNARAVEMQTGPSLTGPWTTAATAANALQRDRLILDFGGEVPARFVRLLITDTGADSYARLPELEIYSAGAAPVELSHFAAD